MSSARPFLRPPRRRPPTPGSMSTLVTKVGRRLREIRARMEQAGVESKLLPGGRSYRRFLILGNIRTGSTMLTSYLGSHPEVRMFYELFHRYPRSIPFNVRGYERRKNDPEVVNLRNTDPVRFLETHVFGRQPQRIRAVGFKLFYTQARGGSPWWRGPEFSRWWDHAGTNEEPDWGRASSDVWEYLAEDKELFVIHLRRGNPLRKAVSAELAKLTGRWGVGATGGAGAGPTRATVRLNADHCLQDFEAGQRMEQEADALFAGHQVLQLSYEDLVSASGAEMERVQQFLGLQLYPLQTKTRKLNRRPLSDVIENYSEVASALRGSPWEHCLAPEA